MTTTTSSTVSTTATTTTNEGIVLTRTVVLDSNRVVEPNDVVVRSKSLRLLVLGCQPVAPYGPNAHTAQLLLESLVQAIQELQQQQQQPSPANKTVEYTITLHVFDMQAQQYPTASDWEHANGCILPGSLATAYDDESPWIVSLRQYIARDIIANQRPTLAICFGHQILAHSFHQTSEEDDVDAAAGGGAGGGLATAVPTGPRYGREELFLTPVGATLLTPYHDDDNDDDNDRKKAVVAGKVPQQQQKIDLLVTHHDMVARLPACALPLGGTTAAPISAAAYFATPAQAQAIREWSRHCRTATNHQALPPPHRPWAVSFQGHPEYASTYEHGVQATLHAILQRAERQGFLTFDQLDERRCDIESHFHTVQADSRQMIMAAGRLLGWWE